jgi:hypothetical protein
VKGRKEEKGIRKLFSFAPFPLYCEYGRNYEGAIESERKPVIKKEPCTAFSSPSQLVRVPDLAAVPC